MTRAGGAPVGAASGAPSGRRASPGRPKRTDSFQNATSFAGRASTKVQAAAPRESASMPSAPLPANRSRQTVARRHTVTAAAPRSSGSAASTSKTASRTLSEVGRVPLPAGASQRPASPEHRRRPSCELQARDAAKAGRASLPAVPIEREPLPMAASYWLAAVAGRTTGRGNRLTPPPQTRDRPEGASPGR